MTAERSTPASAPLPVAEWVLIVVTGAVLIRVAFVLADSSSAASAVGLLSLLVLVAAQRRRATRQPDTVLSNWEQVSSRGLLLAFSAGVMTAAIATVLRNAADTGWAAVAVFVGVALIVNGLVAFGARDARRRHVPSGS